MSAVVDYLESLRAFHELTDELRRPPTVLEYSIALDRAISVTQYRIDRLIELGWLERVGDRRAARSVVVTDRGQRALAAAPVAVAARPAAVPALSAEDMEYGGCL